MTAGILYKSISFFVRGEKAHIGGVLWNNVYKFCVCMQGVTPTKLTEFLAAEEENLMEEEYETRGIGLGYCTFTVICGIFLASDFMRRLLPQTTNMKPRK